MSALLVLAVNPGATIQDGGRSGWKRFGIPPSGAMDAVSARWANLLVGNPAAAPVVELLFGGARFRALQPVTVALAGATLDTTFPQWRSFSLAAGQELVLGRATEGLWSYLAVTGGFCAPSFFGSSSVNRRAGLGLSLRAGDALETEGGGECQAISGRFIAESERPSFSGLAVLPAWRGPEWDMLPEESRQRFLATEWVVSSRSDRAGYQLEGPVLNAESREILSAPVAVGMIQAPSRGQPIVLMRDGPTVGGYPRIALLEAGAVSRFSQCAPGCRMRFEMIG